MPTDAILLDEARDVLGRWLQALATGNGEVLASLMHDRLRHTDPSGVLHRAETLRPLVASMPRTDFDEATVDEIDVQVFGTAAVATGLTRLSVQVDGGSVSGTFRFTDVMVKADGQWLLVATHTTRVMEGQP